MNWMLLDCDVGGSSAYIPKQKNSVIGAAALGAGISALGGLIGSSLQNSANASMDRETRDWQEYMYDKNNNYNLPENQRKRLEVAGINPALAFASGNTGVASSAPNAVNHTPADFSALGAGFSQAGAQFIQSIGTESQVRNLDADTEIKRQQAMTQYSRDMANIQKTLSEENLSNAQRYMLNEQLYQLKDMYDLTKAQNYAQLQNVMSQSELNNQLKMAKALEMELSQKRFFMDKRLTDAQITAISQQIAESVARIRQTDESLALNAKAIANDVVHAMNQDAAAFENIGLSKETISSEKFRNYVGAAAAPILGAVGTGLAVKWRLGVPPHIKGFMR